MSGSGRQEDREERLRSRAEKDRRGRRPQQPQPDRGAKVNVTDPDSRVVRDYHGYFQGYNVQAVTSREQIIVAAEVTRAATDMHELQPMIEAMHRNLRAAHCGPPRVLLADAGYYSEANVRQAEGSGPELLLATRSDRNPARRRAGASLPGSPYANGWTGKLATQRGPASLRAAALDDRTRLRRHQGEPRHPPLHAARDRRVRQRMEADRRHPQPQEALPPGAPVTAACPVGTRSGWTCPASGPCRRAGEVVRLGEVCQRPEYGANTPAVPFDPALPRYVRITDITDDGRLRAEDPRSAEPSATRGYELDPGDLLFARSGATVGKTYLHRRQDEPCAYAGYLIRFRALPDVASPEFLERWTRSQFYGKWVASMLRVGAQPNINATEYSSLLIPLPPLEEQQAIAAVLDGVDGAIERACEERARLHSLQASAADALLTGRVRISIEEQA